MERFATVIWKGSGKDGSGQITTQSAAVQDLSFSFESRFISAHGTNPEELLAAAFAGCFVMKLNFILEANNFITKTIETTAFVNFERGFITGIRLSIKAQVPGISHVQFDENVQDAKINCPVGQIVNTKITAEVVWDE